MSSNVWVVERKIEGQWVPYVGRVGWSRAAARQAAYAHRVAGSGPLRIRKYVRAE